MKTIIQLVGFLFIIGGIVLLISPDLFYDWIEDNLATKSLYFFAIIFRLAFGTLLLMAANESNYPITFKVLGSITIIAALTFIGIGHESFQKFLSEIFFKFKPYAPVTGLIVLLVGGFLIYAFKKKMK